jgi:hypothetical protein
MLPFQHVQTELPDHAADHVGAHEDRGVPAGDRRTADRRDGLAALARDGGALDDPFLGADRRQPPDLPEVRAAIQGERMPGRERDEREVRNHFLALVDAQ